jgi:hypothetical protein
MEVGNDVSELHGPAGQRGLKRAEVHSVLLERHGRELHACLVEQQQGAVVARLLDDDTVAGLEHVAEEQGGGFHRAVCDHHLLGGQVVQLRGNPLTEAGMALAGAV